MGLFGLLDSVSPWAWVALALALGAVELVTFSYYLLWLALAALSVAGGLWLVPDLSGLAQAVIFAGLAVVYTGVGWVVVTRVKSPEPEVGGLNQRTRQLVGRRAVVGPGFAAGVGSAQIDGIPWRARLADPDAPAPVEGAVLDIVGVEGTTLILGPGPDRPRV